jgi:hypothetical protein
MIVSRRGFIGTLGIAAAGIATPLSVAKAAESEKKVLPRPNPATFRSGDFIWPKLPGAYVPYASGGTNDLATDRADWLRARDDYVRSAERNSLSAEDEQALARLRNMEYREFLALYEGDEVPGIPGQYSGGGFYVGHVGILDVGSDAVPWVVEALLHRGVVRHKYADWLKERPGEIVWHGRLKDTSETDGRAVVAEASKHVGKSYDFWNFNLEDDSVFYCSKLAWMSVHRALQFAVDGKNNPKRHIWFSPKQFMHVGRMNLLHDPGSYRAS